MYSACPTTVVVIVTLWYPSCPVLKLNDDGTGELVAPYDIYHMFDFMGRGAEELIVRGPGVIQVYGSSKVTRQPGPVHRDAEYKKKIANHTHY